MREIVRDIMDRDPKLATRLKEPETLERVIEEAAIEYDDTPEQLERHEPDLWQRLLAAYWRETMIDLAEAMNDREKAIVTAFANKDWAEVGRLFYAGMVEQAREYISRKINHVRLDHQIEMEERRQDSRFEGYAEG